jgi:RHS repeat-associated protein
MRRRVRIERTWNGSSWTTNQIVRYVYDGNLVIQERDANNLPLVSYTRGRDLSGGLEGAGGIGGLLARTDHRLFTIGDAGAHAYYHADGNGNITCLINTNQIIVAHYLYDPYGNILSQSGPLAEANLYRFSSKEFHVQSRLVYYLYRLYDPTFQRWLNRDPIRERGFESFRHIVSVRTRTFMPPSESLDGANLYEFVANDSISEADTLGLSWWSDFLWCYHMMDIGHVCELIGGPAGAGSFVPRGPLGKICRRIGAPVAGYCFGVVAGCALDATLWNSQPPTWPVGVHPPGIF